MTDTLDLDHLRSWIGRTETRDELLSPWTASAMAATVRNGEQDWQAGQALPPLWHWCYFLPTAPQNQLGPDGHPARGGFLPPVPLPRRMWAGSQFQFFAPLQVATPATKTSRVADVSLKQGKGGALVFVKVQHEVHAGGTLLLREGHDIVYREAPKAGESAPPQTPPADPAWSIEHRPDAPLLFRYSALTFNSHRIHYDYPYVTQVEGYDDLIVHGPLIATLLLEAAQQNNPGRAVRSYSFKAVRPLTCGKLLRVCGHAPQHDGTVTLWAEDAQGALLMQATAGLE
ncbi:MaoC family dehydratase N-terminal domain-containing protein [Variovorax sp. J22R24]|uniref:FAS1-like dehydratase domain-containing protein n=1 Tax=Variovorax gracilis TaxID=3053502 RepID=UPI0025777EFC|nr:MaoC family dehydratase N-terminal domain-containing protein [Variovorax sp. J22R24]MDM0104601.1 MaoC family dehydratase N-terminal domain-containing protein [Variovorax sp. J22R24]